MSSRSSSFFISLKYSFLKNISKSGLIKKEFIKLLFKIISLSYSSFDFLNFLEGLNNI